MLASDSDHLLRDRIVISTVALLVIFLGGTLGIYTLGEVYLGKHAWSFGECAYFTVTTITTVGFGEPPRFHSVPYARPFTVLVLLMGLGVALYFVSSMTTYFIEGEFGKARMRRRMAQKLDDYTDHVIVCGAGTTGMHVIEELIATRWPVAVVDLDEARLARAQELTPSLLPTLLGDATEDNVLERAGIRRARGIVAALADDKANLFVTVTARELNPRLKIVAKGVEVKAAEKLRRAGADSVVNPAFIGGVRMVSEMIRPQVVEFLDLMLRDKDKNLRIEEVRISERSPLCGKPIGETQIRRHTNVLVVAVRKPPTAATGAGDFVYNPGPETEIVAGMALIVLGETDSVLKLRVAADHGF